MWWCSSRAVTGANSGFHPVYDGADPDLLLQVDDHLAPGNLRDWASFTQSAAQLCAEH